MVASVVLIRLYNNHYTRILPAEFDGWDGEPRWIWFIRRAISSLEWKYSPFSNVLGGNGSTKRCRIGIAKRKARIQRHKALVIFKIQTVIRYWNTYTYIERPMKRKSLRYCIECMAGAKSEISRSSLKTYAVILGFHKRSTSLIWARILLA